MPLSNLLTTRQTARRLEYTPRYVAKLAERGALEPVVKLPGRTGAYLFTAETIAAYAAGRPQTSTSAAAS